MFHNLDDKEWESTVDKFYSKLSTGGLIIIGGYFGFFGNLNVQASKEDGTNKRLRSKRRWKKF